MTSDHPSRIPCGGACLFPLPADPTCAAVARSLLRSAMAEIGLPGDLIEDGALMVSELATNGHLHAGPGPAELWIWGRTRPRPQLVVGVFDTDRTAMPRPGPADPMAECGKGLGIVEHLAESWGAHPSRRRLGPRPEPGKCVWFTLALPGPWPHASRTISPALASRRLLDVLGSRGVTGTRRTDAKGVSLVTAGDVNVWVEPESFSWRDPAGGYTRHPLLDLQDVAEHIVRRIETSAPVSRRGEGGGSR